MIFKRGFYLHPAGALALSFLAAIAFGTFLLHLSFSSTDGSNLSFVDSLFTATSAVCVTGLIVKDTGTFFSPFGQGVILALIQVGGLGIMTLSTAAAVFVKRSMSISQRRMLQEIFDQDYYTELMDLMRGIIKGTFLIEAIGAAILAYAWWDIAPTNLTAIVWGVFHSISAFCNAGFSLFTENLMTFADSPVVVFTVAVLIIAGGLGFIVVGPLLAWRKPTGLHAKLVVWTTIVLIFGGMIFFFFSEYDRLFVDMSFGEKLMNSFFQSVTSRTAGFNTFEQSDMSYGSILMTRILMIIGASPGSTGGGIKTTTFVVLILSVRAWIRRREDVEAFGRRLSSELILKAVTVAFLSLIVVFVFSTALSFTEKAQLHVILFEAASAFGTVGLSLGLTPKLTIAGKLLITALMYIGRLGPITIAIMVSGPRHMGKWHYPTGRVMIG